MPKTPMDEAEIARKRETIIDTAAEVIMEDGFQGLSMRKIGAKIGMTAANLYNYYANKDELNIAIRMRAGRILFEALDTAYRGGSTIEDKLARMVEAYVRFGLLQPNYYSIMFDMPTPKYADYVGTPLETAALKEKESSEESVGLLEACVSDLRAGGYRLPDNSVAFMFLIWGQLHGLMSLYANRLMAEISTSPETTLKEAAVLAHEMVFRYIRP